MIFVFEISLCLKFEYYRFHINGFSKMIPQSWLQVIRSKVMQWNGVIAMQVHIFYEEMLDGRVKGEDTK